MRKIIIFLAIVVLAIAGYYIYKAYRDQKIKMKKLFAIAEKMEFTINTQISLISEN